MSVIDNYIKRLSRYDRQLKYICLVYKCLVDTNVTKLIDCLITYYHCHFGINGIDIYHNCLTDETGVKIARYLALSSTMENLNISSNQFGSKTYLELAVALRVNSSLWYLYTYNNQPVDRAYINTVFVNTLRLNPIRPNKSIWLLYDHSPKLNDFTYLKSIAEKSTPPSMLEFLLCTH